MFERGAETKQGKPVIVDVFLDHETADKFKHYSTSRRIDESHALVEVLERGLANYWLLEFKRLKENYQRVEPLLNEFKKDNETLKRLEKENVELQQILDNKLASKEKTSKLCSK